MSSRTDGSRPDGVSQNSGALLSPTVLCLILFAGTLLLYFSTVNSAFINYDDPAYVTKNAHVLQGLSWGNITWAFTATVEANWHPLTWISHMADVQLFGTNPRGHHAVSILLHALNVLLLFFTLRKATGNVLRSALVACLFAIHPLNVECVAWVAERKSLLSMFFLLLSLAAYGWYVSNRTLSRYLLVLIAFALGLAAKPMIVTLPILLLLWDYWPLERTSFDSDSVANRLTFLRLIAEKIPLFGSRRRVHGSRFTRSEVAALWDQPTCCHWRGVWKTQSIPTWRISRRVSGLPGWLCSTRILKALFLCGKSWPPDC